AAAAMIGTRYDTLRSNINRDVAIDSIARARLVMVVHPSLQAKTVLEFVTYAKANPRKLAMASSVIGGPPHFAGELFKMMTKIDMTHVPYRGGGPATSDLLGVQVHVLFNGVAKSIDHIQSGRLRS